MKQPPPPFLLLQTIEAVTRLGSLKRAADELSVTPSAISHRVRLVEERFGRRLFERDGQGIRATDAARELAAAVEQATAAVDQCWNTLVDDPDARRVRLCAMSAFAEQFILGNMDEFRRRFPDFQMDSTSTTISEGGMRGDYDILIGIGPYPDEGWEYVDLMPLLMKPVYQPAAVPPIVVGNEVLGPLLSSGSDFLPWEAAAKAGGFTIAPSARVVRFDSILTSTHAAVRGKGVALAPAWMADRLAAPGEASVLGTDAIDSRLQYWLAVRKSRKLDSTFGRFRRWLEGLIRQAV